MLLTMKSYVAYLVICAILFAVFGILIVWISRHPDPFRSATDEDSGERAINASKLTRTSEAKGQQMYTAEDYRKALINMILKEDDLFLTKETLPDLRTDRIVFKDKGKIEIGDWQCDMVKQSFLIGRPGRIYRGMFVRSTDYKLTAIIEEIEVD